jgi:hypothetical protein
MNLADYNFENLQTGCWRNASTFAYWIGVLKGFSPDFTSDAKFACGVRAYQYDVEEQADDVEDLIKFRDLGLGDLTPIAPVTLALRWSPFPAAAIALGPPVFFHYGEHSSTIAIFRPVLAPTFPATTSDERHFQFLLRHACERALHSQGWVLLTGSPGWLYDHTDWIADSPDRHPMMADFGFVYCARKPRDG